MEGSALPMNVQISMLVTVFDLFGTGAFAVSGALLGIRKEYNFWGTLALAFCTAVGGGTLRNILVNLRPAVFEPGGWMYMAVILIASTAVYFGARHLAFRDKKTRLSAERLLARSDAIGLAVFIMLGAQTGIMVGLPFWGIIAFSVLTGAGGGVTRDVIAGEKPYAFQEVHYITWCVLAGTVAALLDYERPLIISAVGTLAYKGLFALLPTVLVIFFRFREIELELSRQSSAPDLRLVDQKTETQS